MGSWAELELAPWRDLEIDRTEFERRLRDIAANHATIFLFRIEGGEVHFDDKGTSDGNAGSATDYHRALCSRGQIYARFFSQALQVFKITGSALFALDLTDLRVVLFDIPVFEFQRRRFERVPLFPDVEMIEHDFYIAERFVDAVPFASKKVEAIFVGSTTGDPILSRNHVEKLLNARLRAAVYFKDKANVTFDLPRVVQVDTPETRGLIEKLNVAGRIRDWQEQTKYRFLISIDGNGAACSRLHLTLVGKSVLLKYNSPYELYYFKAMRPWVEFIPISVEEDVINVIESSECAYGLHSFIAQQSAQFARNNLSRIHAMHYTAELISLYIAQFGTGSKARAIGSKSSGFVIDSYTHIANVGTVWSEPAGWAGNNTDPIEGFTLVPGSNIDDRDLIYHGVSIDGKLSAEHEGHTFCGTSGEKLPLYGLSIALRGEANRRYKLRYQARFADGFETSFSRSGARLWHSGIPLTAFRLVVTPRRVSKIATKF